MPWYWRNNSNRITVEMTLPAISKANRVHVQLPNEPELRPKNMQGGLRNVSRCPSGILKYTFRYRSDPSGSLYHGTVTEDLLASHPEAVLVRKDDYYTIL